MAKEKRVSYRFSAKKRTFLALYMYYKRGKKTREGNVWVNAWPDERKIIQERERERPKRSERDSV